jgi:predicted Zn-dependent peptidase
MCRHTSLIHTVSATALSRVAALVAALSAVCCWPQVASAQKVEPEVVILDNGMKFLLVPRTDQPNTVSAGWLAKVGSVNERPGITGISHFFEHMMFKGTNTIGTQDPSRDADFRARQKSLRDAINDYTWSTQYMRYFLGQIDDPWNPGNDTPELASMRAELKSLMDTQQGRANAERIAALKQEMAKADRSSPAGAARVKEIEAQVAQLEAEQKGKGSIVKDEFDQVYTREGGSGMNAFTSHDLTFYFINVPSNKLELWAWMESDRLNDSVFREFYSERDVVHEERRLRTESTPTGIFQEQFDAMFWVSSGYAWPIIGWPSDLNSYTMEEAQRYWNIYYRPNNLVGIIVGDFDPKQARDLIARYFGRLRPETGTVPPVTTLEHGQKAEMRMNAEVDAQPQVEIRYHTVPFRHADSYALDMMAQILNGRTGRLYKGLVEGREIASSAGCRQDSRKYAGYFSFAAETKGDATPLQLEEAWYGELKRLQDEPVSDRELQKVKNQVAADSYRRLQTNFFLLIQMAYAEALGGWEEINEEPKKLQAVTGADIQRVAQKYFAPSNRSVATFTRKAGAQSEAMDPDLAKLPAPMQARVRALAAQLAQETDMENLERGISDIEANMGQMPPERRPLADFMLKKMRQRLDELKSQDGAK